MQTIHTRNIVLGVTGGIAAYKSAELCRLLIKAGAQVRVVMTQSAEHFITPTTFQALTGNPVHQDIFDAEAEGSMGHIELARWADLLLIAPATADFLAKMASGMANDLLSTLHLATPAPVAVAPAMNQQMWAHAATEANIKLLASRGVRVWGPDEGSQACGDVGPGRMLEPVDIVRHVASSLVSEGPLTGNKLVLTAGPTREAIDPVRFLTNHSSGKMGYALAQAARNAGAEVVLISGPVNLEAPEGVRRVSVESALDMRSAAFAEMDDASVFIGCAAVADFRPSDVAEQKIKKHNCEASLSLEKNPDILQEVAEKYADAYMVGFAAETENVLENAQGKLERKKLDMICANDVSVKGQGFNSDQNSIVALLKNQQGIEIKQLGRHSKQDLAKLIIELIADNIDNSAAVREALA